MINKIRMEELQNQMPRRASLVQVQMLVLFTSFWLTRVIGAQKGSTINLNDFSQTFCMDVRLVRNGISLNAQSYIAFNFFSELEFGVSNQLYLGPKSSLGYVPWNHQVQIMDQSAFLKGFTFDVGRVRSLPPIASYYQNREAKALARFSQHYSLIARVLSNGGSRVSKLSGEEDLFFPDSIQNIRNQWIDYRKNSTDE